MCVCVCVCVCMCVCVCHCICNDIQLCVYICAFKYIPLLFTGEWALFSANGLGKFHSYVHCFLVGFPSLH